ncbi:SRPBCC family protein [Microbacterium sp. NPDC076895]|jgi:uncharacterized protein YndB with AHSA1/START domain|uniref:SRPBCC family protein n=1 Tax=Microbacterium sp. NPDC076895 TaxID=3154957 RepID=UPI003427B509
MTDQHTPAAGAAPEPEADRTVVVERLVSAPREVVFTAFTSVDHLSAWWGPDGFTTSTREFDFREGGTWVFTMHGPDGTDYAEWIQWREIAPPERIVLLHGEYAGDPNAFDSVFTFEEVGEQTRVTLSTVFPTRQLRDTAVEEYHAIEGGAQTLAHLAAHVEG